MNPTEHNSLDNPNWADLTLLAESNQEAFANANILTLKAHYREKVYEQAFDRAAREGVTVDKIFSVVEDYAIEIMNRGTVEVQQFVSIDEKAITICIDADRIDDETVQLALNMLLEVDDLAPGKHYPLGSLVSFKPEEAEPRVKEIEH